MVGVRRDPVEQNEVERYREVARRLFEVAKPIRVLSALRWPPSVRTAFLDQGGQVLPSVQCPPFDERPIVEELQEIRRSIYPGGLVDDWLESIADPVEDAARTLAARGTGTFLVHNRALYGTPHTPMRYDPTTPRPSCPGRGQATVASTHTVAAGYGARESAICS